MGKDGQDSSRNLVAEIPFLDKMVKVADNVSSEVRGAPPSPLTYAKTAKIRGGGVPPMLKSQPHFLLGASN